MALLQYLGARWTGKPDAAIVQELGLCRGQVRVDVALVNGVLHGFEIKSDRDCLRRLSSQVGIYGQVLDRATLVVGERHLQEATATVPDWWGILRATPTRVGTRLVTVRRGRANPKRDVRVLVELLWQGEALDLLERRGLARGVRTKPRRYIWQRLSECVEEKVIAEAVRSRLRARSAPQFAPPQP